MSKDKLVLILEDDEALVGALKTTLEKVAGIRVLVARDGQMGLKMALAMQPDLILLDLLMPRMDGLSVLARLRENSWGKTARVIVMTNLSVEDKETQAKQLGVEDYLVKTNVALSEIVDLLRRKLEV